MNLATHDAIVSGVLSAVQAGWPDVVACTTVGTMYREPGDLPWCYIRIASIETTENGTVTDYEILNRFEITGRFTATDDATAQYAQSLLIAKDIIAELTASAVFATYGYLPTIESVIFEPDGVLEGQENICTFVIVFSVRTQEARLT